MNSEKHPHDSSQLQESNRAPNRLVNEQSPYLLQHAHNPVDWYPWGDEAFERARRENKLVFLSIGYSTCHWCHVMEVESFNDPEVAALMNQAFISIKVDREERPDIDSIYMTVAMMMTGSGGWPLTVFLTPDRRPVFAATYIPKNTRYQRPGMLQLIPAIQKVWLEEPHKLLESAERTTTALLHSSGGIPGETLDASLLEKAYQQLTMSFDHCYGGFGGAPKFPTPHRLSFLLRCWKRSGDPQALAIVEKTLQEMRKGGIYDHIGFGFHRYSTDAEWFAPHFEKMLYDQALLVMVYTEAFLATGDQQYQETAREIITYVLRDMRDPEGGFYSAEDADSEGKEGKFYLWTQAELNEVLPADDANFVIGTFNLLPEGNFSGEGGAGANILHLTKPLVEDASRWEMLRKVLFARRDERIKPFKDDKILVDWNGLMIAALAKAAQAFGESSFSQAATDAANFILTRMRTAQGRLLHRYRAGEAGIAGNLNDHAFLIWGLLELYESTFELVYLESALELQKILDHHFWDSAGGGYFLTADDAEALLIRPKEVEDSAMPSGNSVCMLNLLRLARITGVTAYEKQAEMLGKAFSGIVGRYPSSAAMLLSALDFAIGPSWEVVIVGRRTADDTQTLLSALRSLYLPNKVVLLRNPLRDPGLDRIAQFTGQMFHKDGKATAFVCSNFVCKSPTTEVTEMLRLLKD